MLCFIFLGCSKGGYLVSYIKQIVEIIYIFSCMQVQEHGIGHYPIKGALGEDESTEGNE